MAQELQIDLGQYFRSENMEKTIAPFTISRDESPESDRSTFKAVQAQRVYRKIDIRVVPLMFLCYMLQFTDKVVVNYANIMGLSKDLKMKGQDFSWLATAYFIGYGVAAFPQGYLLQRFPATKVLGFNVLCWGIVLCCTAAVHDYRTMVALRTVLGCFEAVINPALTLITSIWYTKKQAMPRFGFWFCGLGTAQIIGGLVSFAAQHGSRDSSFSSWRIMFVSVGAFNVFIAILTLIWMPDSVSSAAFLEESEKQFIHSTLVADQAGNGKRVFRPSFLWEAITDLQVWLMFLFTTLNVITSGVVISFSATLINGWGYAPKVASLLNMPSGAVTIISTLASTLAVVHNFPRWLSLVFLLIPTILGAGLMSFVPTSNQAGVLAGIYLINAGVPPMILIFSLVGSNVQGYTKKVAANTIVAVGFTFANIIGPQTFQAREAPRYLGAKVTLLSVNAAAAVVAVLLRLLYGYRNAQMDKAMLSGDQVSDSDEQGLNEEETEWTDRTKLGFRYVY